MRPWILRIGYWILVITGVCPLALDKSKLSATVFHGRFFENGSWNPWTISRYGHLVGLAQASLILVDSSITFVRKINNLGGISFSQKFVREVSYRLVAYLNRILTVFIILMGIARRRKILLAINDICSIYFNANKSVEPPPNRLFKPVIIFAIVTVFVAVVRIATGLIYVKLSGAFQFLFWVFDADLTVFYAEMGSAVALIYLQTAIAAGLNDDVKRFLRTSPRRIKKGFLINARPFLKKYRTTYRSVSEVIKKINSAFGSINFFSVIFNQIVCVVMAFGFHAKIFEIWYYEVESEKNFEACVILVYLGTSVVWYFVRIIVSYHCFEMVIKEVQLTASLIAALDPSIIDADSKTELVEFLEEIDGMEIRFTASGILTLDYPNLHSVLHNGITLAIIVVQYLYL